MPYTEKEILEELNLAFSGLPGHYYPAGKPNDIRYNFFLDLENGYCKTASSRIHLYANADQWAIVFEKAGYQKRGYCADIELIYIGNCISYPVAHIMGRDYITNAVHIEIIEEEEYDRIENRNGDEEETHGLIGKEVKTIRVRDKKVPFHNDYLQYEDAGVRVREYSNSEKLVGFADVLRYLNETDPGLISATEDEIRKHFPKELKKLMALDKFHYSSFSDKETTPDKQETFRLIAKILCTGDTAYWKPLEEANNHWSNWESGHL
jgi:hypothetical protein